MLTEQEKILVENHIYNLVKKAVSESFKRIDEEDKKEKPKSTDNTVNNDKRRKVIIKWLNSPTLNQTEVMRQLWKPSPDEEDSKRSLFFKKLHGDLNDNGIPYQFDDNEITQLFKIKSHGAIG